MLKPTLLGQHSVGSKNTRLLPCARVGNNIGFNSLTIAGSVLSNVSVYTFKMISLIFLYLGGMIQCISILLIFIYLTTQSIHFY